MPLDPRLNAFRADLADEALRGRIEAERFVAGTPRRIRVPVASIRAKPDAGSMMTSEAVFGEEVVVFERRDDGWSWVQLQTDRYVGWIATGELAGLDPQPTHKITAPAALVFSDPDIKSVPLMTLPLGAEISAIGTEEDKNATYLELVPAGYLPEAYVGDRESKAADWVATSQHYLGCPYLWGGKTHLGLDCSALVQIALQASGVACPRDTDMQEAALGFAIDDSSLRRGDLVFWPGHVGIMIDEDNLLHANAYHMATAVEPVETTIDRLLAKGIAVSSVRRLERGEPE